MTVTYDDASHAYTVDGKRVPSVTEIAGVLTAGKYAEGNHPFFYLRSEL